MLQNVLGPRKALLQAPDNTEIDEVEMNEFNNDYMKQKNANGSACDEGEYEMPTVQNAQG